MDEVLTQYKNKLSEIAQANEELVAFQTALDSLKTRTHLLALSERLAKHPDDLIRANDRMNYTFRDMTLLMQKIERLKGEAELLKAELEYGDF